MAVANARAETQVETAYAQLRRAILTLGIAPGAKLPIQALCARFGVGPTPLREALWQLTGERLVTMEPQCGFRASTATVEDLRGLALRCQASEPAALRLAIRRGKAGWRAAVERSLAQLQPWLARIGDQRPIGAEWERHHVSFHLALLSGCGLPDLLAEIAQWYDRLDRYRRITLPSPGENADTADDHGALAALSLQGEEDSAVALLERHLRDTQEQMLGYFAATPPDA